MAYTYDASDAYKRPPKKNPGKGNPSGNKNQNQKPASGTLSDTYNKPPATTTPTVPKTPAAPAAPAAPSVPDYNPYKEYEKYQQRQEDSLREAREAAERRIQEQISQGVRTLEGQLPGLERQFADGSQEAYRMRMQSQKNLPEMLAAGGINGGASETSMGMLEAQHGNNVNQLRNQYNQGVQGVQQDIANLRSSGNLAIADNANQYAQQLAQAQLAGQQGISQLMQNLQQVAARSSGGGGGGGNTQNGMTVDQLIKLKNAGFGGAAFDQALADMGLTYNGGAADSGKNGGVLADTTNYPYSISAPPDIKNYTDYLDGWIGQKPTLEKIKPIMSQMLQNGLSPALVRKIYNYYGFD